jgi:hypothetical protein
MDWFEKVTGFRELDYERTRSNLSVADGRLRSRHSRQSFAVGRLETPSLGELRTQVATLASDLRPLRVSCCSGDVRRMHAEPGNEKALFQVASQFNLLEMTDYRVTPEDGVTRYAADPTQGPACAIAAGAATIYRNYFAPIGDQEGQTSSRQIDCLRDLGEMLGRRADGVLWRMRNGYALCTPHGLEAIDAVLARCDESELDALRATLRIGVHWNVEVTDVEQPGRLVSQAFCSALPVGYCNFESRRWDRFATLVLEATYEATVLAARLNMQGGGCSTVFLTRVGGGAFGNAEAWIETAMARALELARGSGLDVRLVSFSKPSLALQALAMRFIESRVDVA